MASKIKKFFQKKKLDVKFKKAGEGHKLDSPGASTSTQAVPQGAAGNDKSQFRTAEQTEEKRKAAAAAMARLSSSQKTDTDDSMLYLRARVRKELEAEKQAEQEGATAASPREITLDSAPVLTTILFKCPDIGPAVLPKDEMDNYIEEFLLSELEAEPQMTSALMIQTLNKDKEKVRICNETLVKYLDNVIGNSTEDKFRKIRLGNKVFKERVSEMKGTNEFLQACGFQIRSLPFEDRHEDFYYLEDEYALDKERLVNIKEMLLEAHPIIPQLDRALKVFYPSSSASRFEIPEQFFNVTPEELKKEQQRKRDAAEKLGVLRTKAMRERDEQRELRKYRYTLLRIRMPDQVILQGTFRVQEKVSALFEFVRENIEMDWIPFQLTTSAGQKLNAESLTLAEAGLVPSALTNFSWDPAILAEVKAQKGMSSEKTALKPDIMMLIQNL
ncbi:hypothetical protein ScPMuIL_009703 [Solemya velum]